MNPRTKKEDHVTILSFGWDRWIRTIEMPESKSGALPLGYIPIFTTNELYHKMHLVSSAFTPFYYHFITKNKLIIAFIFIL